MTWHDHARSKLAIFTREEAVAIVAYLEWKRDTDPHGIDRDSINAALDSFWRQRANEAPTQEALRRHVREEAEFLKHVREAAE